MFCSNTANKISAAVTRSWELGAGQIGGSGAAVVAHTPRGGSRAVGSGGMLQAEDGDVGLCQHSFCPGSAHGELGDTRAQGPEVTQQQQLCVQPHQGSALCHVRSHQVLAAQSTFRGTGLLGFLHTSHLHACLSARVKDQPLGTHLQPGIISDLRKF